MQSMNSDESGKISPTLSPRRTPIACKRRSAALRAAPHRA
jgi:hypothetical protein